VDWVKDESPPPPSTYPTIAGGTLVKPVALRRPAIPGVALAAAPYAPRRLDLGKRWAEGIIDREPPSVGEPFAVLVPSVDSLGNDLGGIQSVELRAPLATYFPWQLRTGMAAATDQLVSFAGTFVPLPRTEAERTRRRDPRPSIERLYGTRDAFLERVAASERDLVAARFLLPEDTTAAHARMAATWDWIARQ
jgi:hypothetical protein